MPLKLKLEHFPQAKISLSDDPGNGRDLAIALKHDALLLYNFFKDKLTQLEKELLYLYEFNLLKIPRIGTLDCSEARLEESILDQFPAAKSYLNQLKSSSPKAWCRVYPLLSTEQPAFENPPQDTFYAQIYNIKKKIFRFLKAEPLTSVGKVKARFLALSVLFPQKAIQFADKFVRGYANIDWKKLEQPHTKPYVAPRPPLYNIIAEALGIPKVDESAETELLYFILSPSTYFSPEDAVAIDTFLELWDVLEALYLPLLIFRKMYVQPKFESAESALARYLYFVRGILPLPNTFSLTIIPHLHVLYSKLLLAKRSQESQQGHIGRARSLREVAITIAGSTSWEFVNGVIPILEQSGNPVLVNRANLAKMGPVPGTAVIKDAQERFGSVFTVPKLVCDLADLVDREMQNAGLRPTAKSFFIGNAPCGASWGDSSVPEAPSPSSGSEGGGGSAGGGGGSTAGVGGGPGGTTIFSDWAWCVARFPNDPNRQRQCLEDLQKNLQPKPDVITPAAVGSGFGLGTFLLVGALAFGGYWVYTKWFKPNGAGSGGQG